MAQTKPITTGRQVLKEVLSLFSSSRRWVKGSFAKTAKRGQEVATKSPNARCFCLAGAISRVAPTEKLRDAARARIKRAIRARVKDQYATIVSFNDDEATTFNDVVSVIRSAIRRAA